jgi:subtilase family serine protease
MLLLGAAAGPAAGSTAPAKVAVPQGTGSAALRSATMLGVTPSDTQETVSFVLKARDLGSLEAAVNAGMPGGFLSVSQFADRFGQTQADISKLTSYLATYGISSKVYPDRLDVTATGSAAAFGTALSVQQHQYRVPAVPGRLSQAGRPAMTIHGTEQPALLPPGIAQFVEAILGLSSYPSFESLAVHTPPLAKGVKPAAVQAGILTPEDFAKQYNLNPLYRLGAKGAGKTIGIVTLATVDPADPEYFWSNVLGISTKPNRISLVNVDGGAGPEDLNSGSDETTLDVEQSGALAPDANIVVYQAPNTDYGFVDGFFDAASQNVADAVSTSWGESETYIKGQVNNGTESPAYAVSFDEAFLELAAQGQSAFAASGDEGAYGAFSPSDLGTTNLTAGNPSSSPWITSAGGTTLAGNIIVSASVTATIPAQRTWAWDWLYPDWEQLGFLSESEFIDYAPVGSGGGFSVYEPAPGYQQGVRGTHSFSATQYLTPDDYITEDGMNLPTSFSLNPTPAVTKGTGTGRATPDVSADADPFTGYVLYDSEFNTEEGAAPLEPGWGGTSFVAPQMAGSTVLMDSLARHRVGFWNPQIYRFARQWASPFTPLDTAGTSNDDLYYSGTPGNTYNVGSGLGTPNLSLLALEMAFTHLF